MRWTQEQLDEYRAKFHKPVEDWDKPDPGKESVLQGKIEKWCAEWGRPCLSLKQSPHAKRLLPPGWPDVTIIMPEGRVLFLELKAKGGRLSQEQKQTALQLLSLGHKWVEVRSFKKFMEIINDDKR